MSKILILIFSLFVGLSAFAEDQNIGSLKMGDIDLIDAKDLMLGNVDEFKNPNCIREAVLSPEVLIISQIAEVKDMKLFFRIDAGQPIINYQIGYGLPTAKRAGFHYVQGDCEVNNDIDIH